MSKKVRKKILLYLTNDWSLKANFVSKVLTFTFYFKTFSILLSLTAGHSLAIFISFQLKCTVNLNFFFLFDVLPMAVRSSTKVSSLTTHLSAYITQVRLFSFAIYLYYMNWCSLRHTHDRQLIFSIILVEKFDL